VPQFDLESISDVVLHVRYTAREAGGLKSAAIDHVVTEVLSDPENLERLFSPRFDFADAWQAFTTAPNDASRTLAIAVTQDDFPYWLRRLGMDDEIVATFAVTDPAKRKLVVAPAALPFTGDPANGWTLTIGQGSPVFAFLKKYMAENVAMTVSYAAS